MTRVNIDNIKYLMYHNYLKYSDKHDSANSVDPIRCHRIQQGLHCFPFNMQFLNTSTESEMNLFKFWNKYGKELRPYLRCLNI